MSDTALFEVSKAWNGNPLKPDMETPTPPEMVYRLTKPDREARVRHLIDQAHTIHNEGIALAGNRKVVGQCILFSGGNDSTVLAHLFRETATHAAHANTGIGIEATRQFVRDTCESWGLPLIEKHPPTSYRDLVIEQGFPGPAMHFKMYQRLKERALRQVRRDLVKDGRNERVIFIAGRRRAESARRSDIPLHEVNGSVIWTSPLALWTKPDMQTYRLMMGDVPVNRMSELVGMSGECLCGAFARPGELEMIREHSPETAAEIDTLQADVRAAGWTEPYCTWGHGKGSADVSKTGRMCTSCTITDPLFELMERNSA